MPTPKDSNPLLEMHATVHGMVQGVFFRAFVEDRARVLNLMGWVRNGSDGVSVEVVAQGDEPLLRTLLDSLREGPSTARVDRVDVEWLAPTEAFHTFRIR
jgi:acylphosphatase